MTDEFYLGVGVFLIMVVSVIGVMVLINWYIGNSNASWEHVKKALSDYIQSTDETQKELKVQLNVAQNAVMAEQSRYRELESAHEELQERHAKDMQAWRTENERLDKKLTSESHNWNHIQGLLQDKNEECDKLQAALTTLENDYKRTCEIHQNELQEAREMRSDYRKKLCRLLKCSETSNWETLCSYVAEFMRNVDKLKSAVLDLFDVEEQSEEELES